MNYIDLVNIFWQRDIEFEFSDREVALYFYLLKVSNSIGWKNPFGLSNSMTIAKFGWGKTSFDTAKNTLKKAGLIDFRPGDGRGNVYQYELKVNGKVIKKASPKNTLSDTLSTTLSDTLSKQKPETSLNINKTKSLSGSNEPVASAKPPPKVPGKSKTKPDAAEPKNELYRKCIEQFDEFIRARTDMGAKIDGQQGKAMKNIIAYLTTQVRNKNPGLNEPASIEAKVLESWRLILENWHLMDDWHQGRTRLSDINSELQNILKCIKDGIAKASAGQQFAANPEKTAGSSGQIRGRGASLNELETLRRGPAAGGAQRAEFTDAQIVE